MRLSKRPHYIISWLSKPPRFYHALPRRRRNENFSVSFPSFDGRRNLVLFFFTGQSQCQSSARSTHNTGREHCASVSTYCATLVFCRVEINNYFQLIKLAVHNISYSKRNNQIERHSKYITELVTFKGRRRYMYSVV